MKKDVRKKDRAGTSYSPQVRSPATLARVATAVRLADELATVYRTYPRLRQMVGNEAWQQLTDVVYRQALAANASPDDATLAAAADANITRLEDIAASSLVRDETGLRDILARVLLYRLSNGLATRGRA